MMLRQALKFGLVGAAATGVHIAAGVVLIGVGWPAALANPVAFLFAFGVSFAGHLWYSFAQQNPDPRRALRRFAVVAGIGFVCNEAILIAILQTALVTAPVALALSTACAAALTFVLSRLWAFQAGPDRADGSARRS